MDKQKIYNQYANEQGYESWKELMSDEEAYVFETMIHVDNVTDLIQEELKKKIADRFNGGFERCRVIETEIL